MLSLAMSLLHIHQSGIFPACIDPHPPADPLPCGSNRFQAGTLYPVSAMRALEVVNLYWKPATWRLTLQNLHYTLDCSFNRGCSLSKGNIHVDDHLAQFTCVFGAVSLDGGGASTPTLSMHDRTCPCSVAYEFQSSDPMIFHGTTVVETEDEDGNCQTTLEPFEVDTSPSASLSIFDAVACQPASEPASCLEVHGAPGDDFTSPLSFPLRLELYLNGAPYVLSTGFCEGCDPCNPVTDCDHLPPMPCSPPELRGTVPVTLKQFNGQPDLEFSLQLLYVPYGPCDDGGACESSFSIESAVLEVVDQLSAN